jgi:hypothetical protein
MGIKPLSEMAKDLEAKQEAVSFLKSVNDGSGIQVIDISRKGLLLETEALMRPQMKIQLTLATREGLIKINGSVQRSSIASLKGIPRYQSTVTFENPSHESDDFSEGPESTLSNEQKADGPLQLYLVVVAKNRPAQ